MKQLGRWAFNIVAGVPLVLCIGVLSLWISAQWVMLNVQYRGLELGGAAACFKGHLLIIQAGAPLPDEELGWRFWGQTPDSVYTFHRGPPDGDLGIVAWWHGNFIRYKRFAVSWWGLTLLFAVLPAIRLASGLLRRRRALLGLCPNCSYDLRATPDRCPECGTLVSRPAA